jgi:GDP-L-fucose synthase
MDKHQKIYIAGHRGLVGSAILATLQAQGYQNLVYQTSAALDLTDSNAVEAFFAAEKPDVVILAAAKVGGIYANNAYPADFLLINLQIQNNVIDAAYRHGVSRFLFLGSSCIYPKFAEQPLKEEALLTGSLEPTNEAYAIAKIAGIKMCQAYRKQYGFDTICAMPTNMYGENDNFDLQNSHVLPALMRKFHEAKLNNATSVEVWGSGNPKREFLHSSDLAKGCIYLLEQPQAARDKVAPDLIFNVGCGEDLSIKALAEMIQEIVGFKGDLVFDASKPDGTPRKLMDVSRMFSLGWQPQLGLKEGITKVYEWYQTQQVLEAS